MGRHRNDPRGLARIVIIGVAVVAVVALVVIGGTALVSSLNSDSTSPAVAAPASEQQSAAAAQPKTVYAKIEVVGERVEIYAAAPGNTKVYWDGIFNQGDVRDVLWKDLDMTISDPSAVRISVRGQRFPLPKKKDLGLQFSDGELKIVG